MVQGVDDHRLPEILRVCREALARQGAERSAYLDAACASDGSLRREVDSLLGGRSDLGAFLDTPPWWPAETLEPGTRLGPYDVLSLAGEGGMGQVYRARDTRLDRTVAIKILPPEFDGDSDRLARFEREARTIAGLNHPHICTLHDVGEEGGVRFLVMEYVEGRTLAEFLRDGPPAVDVALRVAAEIADAVSAAHRRGVIHRDLKPTNVMITQDEAVTVLDFGLATSAGSHRLVRPGDQAGAGADEDRCLSTRHGVLLGTAPYMSPEQVEGGPIDARSDVFSLGAVLYELLTGRRAFEGDSPVSTMAAVQRDTPAPARQVRPGVPRALEDVVARCLEKRPERRYASAVELHEALVACQAQVAARTHGPWAWMRQPRFAVPVLVVVAAMLAGGSWSLWRSSRVTWARTVGLPEIRQLLDEGRSCAAFRLVDRVERHLPGDPELARIRENFTRHVSIQTDPPGADVYIRDYLGTATDARWEHLGRTPLQAVPIPAGYTRYRMSKPGLRTAEGYTASAVTGAVGSLTVRLEPEGSSPTGMVRVSARPPLGDFWLDTYEVTNRQFQAFVAVGAYDASEFWKGPFVKDGRAMDWREAVAGFRDSTGRPGPATWASGTFPDGQDDYPVGGVSWHEATAYCAFAGKALPTVHHWRWASGQGMFAAILQASNFTGRGPAPVGRYGGLGPFGTYDGAGNVREWCLNAAGDDRRYILGGAWDDPKYLFYMPDARSPLDRSSGNGFRCAKYEHGVVDGDLANPTVSLMARRTQGERPVDEATYRIFKSFHEHDHGDLDAKIEATDDTSPYWRRETISFRAAYGSERVTAYLFLPRNADPPFQAVVTFPGIYAFDIPSSARLETQWFDFIVRSGRALLHPVYKGTYERTIGGTYGSYSSQPGVWRDLALQWHKDLGRSLDYLVTRPDIDREKLAFQGISVGAAQGPRLMALEPRLKAGVLMWGGLGHLPSPEIDSVNYAPRSRAPTLMVNGQSDMIFPYETTQAPMFRLLGAADHDKRHLRVADAGHVAFNQQVVREVVGWYDKHLGPVTTR